MKTIKIREPIWHNRSVGLDESKLEDITKVRITYKKPDGNRTYPNDFSITKEKAMRYKTEKAKRNPNVILRIIPIHALTVIE